MDNKKVKENKCKFKKRTVGYAAHKKAIEAFKTFEYFKNCDDEKLRNSAISLAKHDLLITQMTAEFALKELEQLLQRAVISKENKYETLNQSGFIKEVSA